MAGGEPKPSMNARRPLGIPSRQAPAAPWRTAADATYTVADVRGRHGRSGRAMRVGWPAARLTEEGFGPGGVVGPWEQEDQIR